MPKPNEAAVSPKTEDPTKVERSIQKDIKYNPGTEPLTDEERKEILKIVRADVEYGIEVQLKYVDQKELDIKQYQMAKPSELDPTLTKANWQSDVNLGLARAVADSYQSTIFATSWNPDSINYVATQAQDLDNRNNQAKFTKWGMGKHEANAAPEVDGFIHNRIAVGTSFFKIYKKVWYEWVDKRIPHKDKSGNTDRWEIKTKKVRMEKGLIENVPDIDDILIPKYGKNIQELPFFIQRLHLDGETVLGHLDSKPRVFAPKSKAVYKKKLLTHAYDEIKKRQLGEAKLKNLGITSDSHMSETDIRRTDVTLYEWYGMFTRGGRTEKYRMIVDLVCDEVLSMKPVRSMNRSGKIPFAGGSLNRIPGQIRGESLMQVIAPITDAFNNVFNQKSDFQYVTNCPFGFHNPDEGWSKQLFELIPGVSYPVNGNVKDAVYFPNLSRSMAWAESDLRILFEVLERLTGAATFFQSANKNVSGTATRDVLIDKNSETRFGLWVNRTQGDISEAVGMWFELYQDYPPKNLAERVVGEDGKKLFPNLTIDDLRGDPGVQMTPDVVAGSKSYRKELALWAYEAGKQSIWLQPQINPRGSWKLDTDTFKEVLNLSDSEVKELFGEQPKAPYSQDDLDNEWFRFLRGEDFDPPEGATTLALQHMEGHMQQKDEKLHDLPEEYRPNFEAHLFKTVVNAMNLIKNSQVDRMANTMATDVIMSNPNAGQAGPGALSAPVQQTPEVAMPNVGGLNA